MKLTYYPFLNKQYQGNQDQYEQKDHNSTNDTTCDMASHSIFHLHGRKEDILSINI